MAARPRKPPDSPALEVRRFSTEFAGQAIKRLETRIAEVTALGDQAVRHDDEKARATERRIRSTILEIFGERSPEYRDHQYHDISGGMSVVVGGFGDEPDAHEPELQENFVAGIRRTVTMLESLIDTVRERTDDAVDPVGRARASFEGLDLHPRIAQVSADLYRDGHYRNAVLDAGIALVNFVKEKSRRHDLEAGERNWTAVPMPWPHWGKKRAPPG